MDIMQTLTERKIIAIFRGVAEKPADETAAALVRGGIRLMEVTMNTEGALSIVSRWRESFEGQSYIGAGTVLDLEMAKEAVAAGAQFLISPNLDEAVVAYGLERGVDVFPGAMTPTEIVRAWKAGARAVKLFPMASLGIGYLKEIRAPLESIPIIATGGVRLDNIEEYVRAGAAGFGLGSSLVDKKRIEAGKFDEIEQTARKFVDAVAEAKTV